MITEGEIQKNIMLSLSKLGHRLFRCNTAQGWVGQSVRFSNTMMVKVNAGDVVIRNARPLHAGLTEGGSDLIGWSNKGLFVALETKTLDGKTAKDRLEKQLNFIEQVKKAGGIAGICHNEEEAIKLFS